MALEALSTSELLNYIIYDSTFAPSIDFPDANTTQTPPLPPPPPPSDSGVPPRKKRRRRPKICKNKEEAETQRMTHIAVERNRRKQMNEHLSVLRSLMPESYIHRGDQASIVGGAIEFVKEMEHILQTLQAKKAVAAAVNVTGGGGEENPFSQFFLYPQISHKYVSQMKSDIADIEVTLIETHANIRILCRLGNRRRSRNHLSKLVISFYAVAVSILHLNVTTLESLLLYSISAKVEEGCQYTSADDIAGAVHHMLVIMEEEDVLF